MPVYNYVATDSVGATVRGKMTAINELDLEDRLSDLGLVILESKPLKPRKGSLFGQISTKELIMFCVHLEQLDRAGVPLLDALADMRDSADSPNFRDLMTELYESVKGGDILSVAMEKRKDIFNEVFIGLIKAGEQTGNMGEAFGQLAEHLKWNNDLKRAIKKAIRYPIMLILVMVIVISLMMLFVVPQLTDFLTSQGFSLPIHTLALIALSNFFVNYWYLVFFGPLILFFTLIVLYRTSTAFKYKMDAFLLKVPFVGQVILKINMARFSHFFAITFSSGIGVLECLNTARNVASNSVIKESIQFIIQSVSEGNSLTRSISSTQRFPSLVVRMFKVGEDSGNMEDALENVNFFYDREVHDSVNALIGFIQPALTVVMGGMMFWVTAAVFGPLYESFSKLNF